jgi:hypothetical protein
MELRAETVDQLADAMGVDVDSLLFESKVIPHGRRWAGSSPRLLTADYGEVMAWSAEQAALFAAVPHQVTIDAGPTPYVHGLFAIRHLTGQGDSGWRIWFPDRDQVVGLEGGQ